MDYGACLYRSWLCLDLAWNPMIAQPIAKPGVVDVTGYSRIMAIVHQERKGESPQHPFDRSPPSGFLLLNFDQLTGKWQVHLRKAEGCCELTAQLHHRGK